MANFISDRERLYATRLLSEQRYLNLLDFNDLPRERKSKNTGSRQKSEKEKFLIAFKEAVASGEKANGGDACNAFENNIQLLQAELGLNTAEREVVIFAAIAHLGRGMNLLLRHLGEMAEDEFFDLVAHAIGIPEQDAQEALRHNGKLMGSGLLCTHGYVNAAKQFSFINGFPECLNNPCSSVLDLFRECFLRSQPSELQRSDFDYLDAEIRLMENYLEQSLESNRKGVNVLLYGAPGTGKTAFSKLLAKLANAHLYEIATMTPDGFPIKPRRRARLYIGSQHVLAATLRSILLFDEVEDIFSSNRYGMRVEDAHDLGKGAINSMLEENSIPAIWACNTIYDMEAAYLRRFDIILEFTPPPRAARRRMFNFHVRDLEISEQAKEEIASNEVLTPAQIERTARVIRTAAQHDPDLHHEENMRRLLASSLKAQGLKWRREKTAESYSLEFLNIDRDIDSLIEGITNAGNIRICLFGLPGTGKTAFGTYLAKRMQLPLLKYRASDLLAPYLGETEQHIATMFERAERENAVLLLDEADSFLRERKMARANWEITVVNEMLTQIENFNGVLVATTNLVSTLDSASMRRFDLKIRFSALRPEQIWTLFKQSIELLGLDSGEKFKKRIMELNGLTPGDFAVARRQMKLLKQPDSAALWVALAKEVETKDLQRATHIGFV